MAGFFMCVWACVQIQTEIKRQNINNWRIYVNDLHVFILLPVHYFVMFEFLFQKMGKKSKLTKN